MKEIWHVCEEHKKKKCNLMIKFSEFTFSKMIYEEFELWRVSLQFNLERDLVRQGWIYIYIYIYICARQKCGRWVGPHLGSQSICDVGFGFPNSGSSQHRDPTKQLLLMSSPTPTATVLLLLSCSYSQFSLEPFNNLLFSLIFSYL